MSAILPQTNVISKTISDLHVLVLKEAFLFLFSSYCDSVSNCSAYTLCPCNYRAGKCKTYAAFKHCIKMHDYASAA